MQTLQYNFADIEPKVKQTLYDAFGPHIAVGTEEVDNGRIFLKVVASKFNGMSEKKKQDAVWKALKKLGPESQAISLALVFGIDEI